MATRSGGSPPPAPSPSSPSRLRLEQRAGPAITAGPDGNLWFTEGSAATRSGGSPRPASSPSSRSPRPPVGPSASRPARTATSGSPKHDGNKIGRITPAGVDHRVRRSPRAGSRPARHHGRPGRQPLVHRILLATRSGGSPPPASSPSSPSPPRPAAILLGITAGPDGNLWFTETDRQQDRADHPDRRHHRVPAPHGSDSDPTAASRPARTATSGSPKSAATRSGGSPRPASSPSSRSPRPSTAIPAVSRPARTATSGSPNGCQPDRADHDRYDERRASPAPRAVPERAASR